jgi:hypothetical protein
MFVSNALFGMSALLLLVLLFLELLKWLTIH